MLPMPGIPKRKHNKDPGHCFWNFRSPTPPKTTMEPENAHLEKEKYQPKPSIIDFQPLGVVNSRMSPPLKLDGILFWHSECISSPWVSEQTGRSPSPFSTCSDPHDPKSPKTQPATSQFDRVWVINTPCQVYSVWFSVSKQTNQTTNWTNSHPPKKIPTQRQSVSFGWTSSGIFWRKFTAWR